MAWWEYNPGDTWEVPGKYLGSTWEDTVMIYALCIQMDSDRDQPDTPGIHRTQSFDLNVFDIRRVPPEQIAVSFIRGY